MIWLFIVLSALVAFVVAAVSVGSVTARQAQRARPAVYDLEAAVLFVGDHLPDEVSAQVSYDEVRQVLLWHVEYLEEKGVASYRTDPDVDGAMVVLTDDEPTAHVLGRVDRSELELTDEQVVAILVAQDAYYERIGAVGRPVSGPADPT